MVRFIHTSDWQLGMTRRFLNPDAQALYSQARIDMIKAIGRTAKSENCLFIAVADDVFEYEHMDRRTVSRALEAMGETEVPVVLLPGNHDPYHEDSVYSSKHFDDCKRRRGAVNSRRRSRLFRYGEAYRDDEVLSRAAQKCQIIILTCMPSRFAYVEPALRINMEELTAKSR